MEFFLILCKTLSEVYFSRQESWSGLPFLSPGDLANPGIEPASPALAGGFFTTEPPGNYCLNYTEGCVQVICKYYSILYEDLIICGFWYPQGPDPVSLGY